MAETDASSDMIFHDFMHKAVGKVPPGGHAIVISLATSPERAAFVHKSLSPLGVDLVDMQAVTEHSTREELHSACGFEKYPGALTDESRARAASHKKALVMAAERKENWTLILEDDVAPLPIPHEQWLAGFDAAWQRLKHRDPAVVRLGWCQFNGGKPEVENLENGFQIIHRIMAGRHDREAPEGINNGLCSTAYIVSKKYVHQMIQAFPGCHEPLDLFYAHELFNKKPFSNKVWSITHQNSTKMFKAWRDFEQHGLIAQKPADIEPQKVTTVLNKVSDAKVGTGEKSKDEKASDAKKKTKTQ
jgi:GR25 family glycosyltransferase involved in LPS biosynthesis